MVKMYKKFDENYKSTDPKRAKKLKQDTYREAKRINKQKES